MMELKLVKIAQTSSARARRRPSQPCSPRSPSSFLHFFSLPPLLLRPPARHSNALGRPALLTIISHAFSSQFKRRTACQACWATAWSLARRHCHHIWSCDCGLLGSAPQSYSGGKQQTRARPAAEASSDEKCKLARGRPGAKRVEGGAVG